VKARDFHRVHDWSCVMSSVSTHCTSISGVAQTFGYYIGIGHRAQARLNRSCPCIASRSGAPSSADAWNA